MKRITTKVHKLKMVNLLKMCDLFYLGKLCTKLKSNKLKKKNKDTTPFVFISAMKWMHGHLTQPINEGQPCIHHYYFLPNFLNTSFFFIIEASTIQYFLPNFHSLINSSLLLC